MYLTEVAKVERIVVIKRGREGRALAFVFILNLNNLFFLYFYFLIFIWDTFALFYLAPEKARVASADTQAKVF